MNLHLFFHSARWQVRPVVSGGRTHRLLRAVHLSADLMLQSAFLSHDDLSDSRRSEQSVSAAHCAPAHPLTYVLSHCACLAFLLYAHHATAFSPPGPFCFFSLSLISAYTVTSFSLSQSPISLRLLPDLPPVGLGGQQALTVVLAVDCEVTFAHPHWDSAAECEPQRQREGEVRGE